MPWVVPIALAAAAIYSSSQSDKSQKDAFKKQLKGQDKQNWQARDWALQDYQTLLADWQKNAFPKKGAIRAEKQRGRQALGQAFQGLPEKVFSQSASRGFGPGSGLTMESLGNIEGSYMQALSQMMTNFAQFKNTPQWGPPMSIGTKHLICLAQWQVMVWKVGLIIGLEEDRNQLDFPLILLDHQLFQHLMGFNSVRQILNMVGRR